MSRRRFRDLKIGARQAVGFGLILSMLAAGSTFTVWRMSDLRERIEDISDIWLHRAVAVSDFNQNVSVLRTKQLQHAFARREQDREPFVADMLNLIDEINTDADTYLNLVTLANERGLHTGAVDSLIRGIGDQWDTYLDHSLEYLELIDAGRSDQALALLSGPADQVFDGLSGTLEELVSLDAALAEQAASLADRTYVSTRNRAILVLLISIAVTVVIGLALSRSLTRPLNELVRASRAIGEGRFDVVPVARSNDELGALTRTFRWMAKSLGTQQERLKRANTELEEKSVALEHQNEELELTLERLRQTQEQLVLKEKMASLGQLTAGIAHEIKNPLNFINNFADLSVGLTRELRAKSGTENDLPDVREMLDDLEFNAARIAEHGRRADTIVRGMLEHSRSASDERAETDLNALAEEYLNLAYHGMRARFPGSNVTLHRDYDDRVGIVPLAPREVGRVLLNLLSNAFDAVRERRADSAPGFEPEVTIRTRRLADQIEIRIADNGRGVPPEIRERIFQPFFTTKPTGAGNTGLGLSLSYDIITVGHSGTLRFETATDVGTEFIITLPAPVGRGPAS